MNARTLFYPKNGVNVKHNFEPILFSFRNEIAFGWLMFARTSTHVHMELGFSTSILDIFGWTIFCALFFAERSCYTIRLPLEYGTLDRLKIIFLLNAKGEWKNFQQKKNHHAIDVGKSDGKLNMQQYQRYK